MFLKYLWQCCPEKMIGPILFKWVTNCKINWPLLKINRLLFYKAWEGIFHKIKSIIIIIHQIKQCIQSRDFTESIGPTPLPFPFHHFPLHHPVQLLPFSVACGPYATALNKNIACLVRTVWTHLCGIPYTACQQI